MHLRAICKHSHILQEVSRSADDNCSSTGVTTSDGQVWQTVAVRIGGGGFRGKGDGVRRGGGGGGGKGVGVAVSEG